MVKTYLITGASSDVGHALMERLLARLGPDDQIIAQGSHDLARIADLCKAYPGVIHPYDVDLTSSQAIGAFVDDVSRSYPVPTHIVHLPALRAVNTKFKNFDEERFELDMNVQVNSAIHICKAFLPKMAKARWGRVLFIQTSYTIGTPPKNMAAYVMAKSAIGGLVKSLAVEYAPYGVTVNCVAPCMMETNFLAETPDLIVQAAAAANPMGRNARVEDVVPAMEFLLGDEAGFITGVTLPVTGGSTLA